jgi:hypothetical protein
MDMNPDVRRTPPFRASSQMMPEFLIVETFLPGAGSMKLLID